MALSFAQSTFFVSTRPSLFLRRNGGSLKRCNVLACFTNYSSSFPYSTGAMPADNKAPVHRHKWRAPVASVLELGGLKVSKDGEMKSEFLLSILIILVFKSHWGSLKIAF